MAAAFSLDKPSDSNWPSPISHVRHTGDSKAASVLSRLSISPPYAVRLQQGLSSESPETSAANIRAPDESAGDLIPLLPLYHQNHSPRSSRILRHPWKTRSGKMKFGTLLELNSNIEWFDKYVDYDGLKKLFPNEPFDPSYHRGRLGTGRDEEEASPLLQAGDDRGVASQEEFIAACDRERNKVIEFYKEKEEQLVEDFRALQHEVKMLEDRELEDVIEEDEEEEEAEDADADNDGYTNSQSGSRVLGGSRRFSQDDHRAGEGAGVFGSPPTQASTATGFFKRFGQINRSTVNVDPKDETDLLEAALSPAVMQQQQTNARVLSKPRSRSRSAMPTSPIKNGSNTGPSPKFKRAVSDYELPSPGMAASNAREHRLSVSSASSGGGPHGYRYRGNLGLIPMDNTGLADSMISASSAQGGLSHAVSYIWTANSDYGKVVRIGFKKRIAALWLEGNSLGQYTDLNMTAFEKILKKYDKNTNSELKKRYIAQSVLTSYPWKTETKERLNEMMDQILYLYARVAAGGDVELAKQQLRAQLREKIVVDRETVWSRMVQERRRENQQLKVVGPDGAQYASEKTVIRTPIGTLKLPSWIARRPLIFILACGVLVGVIQAKPFDREEESNCLGMLLFCTILWATEAIPLFVTSFFVPFLTVVLRMIRSSDGEDVRLSAADATKYIFSQMFSPTIMLLIGGFTIAAVLSKTRLDVMTATRVLNAAGSKPSVVLLCLMLVATFASMWISNVAAPTLCYALIKPITDELPPKSAFSRCLIIAIALAANIGGQASPISSPQNLIALASMDVPLSWLQWFAIALPVATVSIVAIWAFLHINYRWEHDLEIPRMRKNQDPLTMTHYYVLFVTLFTIALWCGEKSLEAWIGDMGIIAIIPIIAFFGTGILSKDDFHNFHWSIVFLAMGGIALGKTVLSSGLLDDLNRVLENAVEGKSLYTVLIFFSGIALVIATFISHTIAAVLLVPIAEKIGSAMEDPHPRLLIMATALICSAGMGLPVSGFPNMTAITQENKLGQRYIEPSDFLKNGIPASILALIVIVTIGYAVSRALGL
ncbi:hypothetical protein NliqN6_2411 [Naganishia liquefaciens]|uniref:SPX domain-containing protein n=1 Tax=Naganishia liquefaciens TaxID=104408 RepID=A0A8H3TS57_9TREE|nr:hypothetical protein NliqN6_2411 [Naganishia liquefaciens]